MNQDDKKLNRVADVLRVIGHPTRMKIMLLLAKQGPLSVSTIQVSLRQREEQSLISRHLIKMKDKGILASERQGKENHYALSDPSLINVVDMLSLEAIANSL